MGVVVGKRALVLVVVYLVWVSVNSGLVVLSSDVVAVMPT
jgi:hypothetical protein